MILDNVVRDRCKGVRYLQIGNRFRVRCIQDIPIYMPTLIAVGMFAPATRATSADHEDQSRLQDHPELRITSARHDFGYLSYADGHIGCKNGSAMFLLP